MYHLKKIRLVPYLLLNLPAVFFILKWSRCDQKKHRFHPLLTLPNVMLGYQWLSNQSALSFEFPGADFSLSLRSQLSPFTLNLSQATQSEAVLDPPGLLCHGALCSVIQNTYPITETLSLPPFFPLHSSM